MASKGTRLSKKEDANVSLEAITNAALALATEFKTLFGQLDSKLEQIKLTVEDRD